MSSQKFGGEWTRTKLEAFEKYLRAYTTILTKYFPEVAYIDAFAGTGSIYLADGGENQSALEFPGFEREVQDYIRGSASVALSVEPRFTHCYFIEKYPHKVAELKEIVDHQGDPGTECKIILGDANSEIVNLCRQSSWLRRRALMLLHPYGMQTHWSTIEAIANTKSIDLWILFPLVGVVRLLRRDGQIEDANRACLDRLFGESEWYEKFYQPEDRQSDLFGEATIRKTGDHEAINSYWVARLKSVFPEVLETPLLLRNSKGNPIFLFSFASSNPKGAKTAVKIARDILGKYRACPRNPR